MQSKYGATKQQGTITLVDVGNSNAEFKISFDDLKNLDGMKDMTFQQLIQGGKVTVKEGKVLKPSTYKLKSDISVLSETYRRNFMKSIQGEIKEFASERTANTRLTNEEFAYELSASITNVFKGGIAKFRYLEDILDVQKLDAEIKELSEFVNDKFQRFIGKEHVGESVYINEKIPATNDLMKSDIPSIIKYLNSRDSYFNLSYGHFYSDDGDKAIKKSTGVFYISSGKKINGDPVFAEKTSGIEK